MSRQVIISEDKFKCFVRYVIQVAKDKRCVPYYELENVFGLAHNVVGWYAGRLGDYCNARSLPMLNCLIVSSTTCEPSEGFEWYLKHAGTSWGEMVSSCWKKFHVTSTKA